MADYDSIPTSGTHRGPKQNDDTGTEVRADRPSNPGDPSNESVFQLVHSEGQRRYRLRRWKEGTAAEEGYREVGRFGPGELEAALGQVPSESRFVVFENTETGEVHLESQRNISANWSDDGRFDQVILFDDEADAAEYAASRQG